MAKKKKRVAIFDIDGTIFRSSLTIELTDAFIQEGIFGAHARSEYAMAYKNWLERKDIYEKYVMGVVRAFEHHMKGVRKKDFLLVTQKVSAFHQNRVYRYTRDLVKKLKKQRYFLLAISRSPREIVHEFCKKFGFNKVYGTIYEIDKRGRFTGEILHPEILIDKSKILKRAVEGENLTLKGSVGVGDTEGDIPFLKMVSRPICFNPNKKLYQYARRHGWKIVVERKDVVYTLHNKVST